MIVDTPNMGNVVNFPAMPKKATFKPQHRLRELRESKRLSLEVLAEAVSSNVATLSRNEIGGSNTTLHHLKTMAGYHGIPAADTLLPEDGGLSERERRLINTIREIPAALRDTYWNMMESHQPLRGAGEIIPLPAKQG